MELTIDAPIIAHAMRIHLKRKRFIWLFSYSMIAISWLCIGIMWVLAGWSIIQAIILLLTLMILALMGPLQKKLMTMALQRQFNQMNAHGDDVSKVTVNYNEDEISFVTKKSDTHIAWSGFTEWYEADGVMLLYRNARFFHVLPLNQIETDDADVIRMHLQNSVKAKG
ncbi:MAG: YcxB family protein [Alphaproteobacteria bacterium]|nr:YcxB family protein [Alphaproteobacteria bacterium]